MNILQIKPGGDTTALKYLEPAEVTGVRITHTPQWHSASGYGGKIPTQYLIKVGHMWYRVYCMQYSNTGSLYIKRRNETVFCSRIEGMLEDARDEHYRELDDRMGVR